MIDSKLGTIDASNSGGMGEPPEYIGHDTPLDYQRQQDEIAEILG